MRLSSGVFRPTNTRPKSYETPTISIRMGIWEREVHFAERSGDAATAQKSEPAIGVYRKGMQRLEHPLEAAQYMQCIQTVTKTSRKLTLINSIRTIDLSA